MTVDVDRRQGAWVRYELIDSSFTFRAGANDAGDTFTAADHPDAFTKTRIERIQNDRATAK